MMEYVCIPERCVNPIVLWELSLQTAPGFCLTGSPDSLRIEYLVGRRYPATEPEIRGVLHSVLHSVPTVREAVESGRLVLGAVRHVTIFSTNHTLKRSILDRRF